VGIAESIGVVVVLCHFLLRNKREEWDREQKATKRRFSNLNIVSSYFLCEKIYHTSFNEKDILKVIHQYIIKHVFFFLSVLNMYVMIQSHTDELKHKTIEFSLI
jgi:hypothetical protein